MLQKYVLPNELFFNSPTANVATKTKVMLAFLESEWPGEQNTDKLNNEVFVMSFYGYFNMQLID